MSAGQIILTIAEVLAGIIIVIGFMYEDKVIAWEQRMKKKICRYIYNKIVEYEDWRDLKRVEAMAKTLFADTYKYQERYELFSSVFGDEHPEAISSGGKWFACSQLIRQNDLEELYQKYCESQINKVR